MVEEIHYPITTLSIYYNIVTTFIGCFYQGLRLSQVRNFIVHAAQYLYDGTFLRILLQDLYKEGIVQDR